MNKLITYLLGSLATALGLALLFTLNIFLTPILGYWMVAIDFIYIFAGLALISYVGDLSIPLLRILLKREYYRVKFRLDKKGKKASPSFYLKLLASLIMLFKSAEAGYKVIKDEAHILHSKALLFVEKEKGKTNTKASHKQLFNVHKTKQRRAATISAGTLVLLVIGSVIVGLLSSLIFPAIYQSRAATYTWTQDDWSGGTSTDVAIHPTNQIGWTKYAFKDDNISIDGSGNITMTSGSQDMVDNSNSDFSQGSRDNSTESTEVLLHSSGSGTLKLTHCQNIIIINGIKYCSLGCMSLADCQAIVDSELNGYNTPTLYSSEALSVIKSAIHTCKNSGCNAGYDPDEYCYGAWFQPYGTTGYCYHYYSSGDKYNCTTSYDNSLKFDCLIRSRIGS